MMLFLFMIRLDMLSSSQNNTVRHKSEDILDNLSDNESFSNFLRLSRVKTNPREDYKNYKRGLRGNETHTKIFSTYFG